MNPITELPYRAEVRIERVHTQNALHTVCVTQIKPSININYSDHGSWAYLLAKVPAKLQEAAAKGHRLQQGKTVCTGNQTMDLASLHGGLTRLRTGHQAVATCLGQGIY